MPGHRVGEKRQGNLYAAECSGQQGPLPGREGKFRLGRGRGTHAVVKEKSPERSKRDDAGNTPRARVVSQFNSSSPPGPHATLTRPTARPAPAG